MAYAGIDYIEVKNFMVYKDARVSFNDDNIINLKGYNSSGKSAMLKAIVSCLLNMYPKAQTKFIRHGETYFRIIIKFKDGVLILKDRYVGGQSLYEVYKNDELIFTTKVGNRLTKVDDVPEIIEEYLGLCTVSTGALNYQVRNDPLWLIETTGSENYNSLNEILKSEEISRANSLLNSDRNKLSSEITGIEASLNEVKLSLIDISDYTDELLHKLEYREELCKGLASRYSMISSLMRLISDIKNIQMIPNVKRVEFEKYSDIENIVGTLNDYNSIVFVPNVEKCKYDRLSDILDVKKSLNEYTSVDGTNIPKVQEIKVESISDIKGILDSLKDYVNSVSNYEGCINEYQELSLELDIAVNESLKNGIRFIRCDTCGSYIEVKNDGGGES